MGVGMQIADSTANTNTQLHALHIVQIKNKNHNTAHSHTRRVCVAKQSTPAPCTAPVCLCYGAEKLETQGLYSHAGAAPKKSCH
jgi:hypothetical protein